MRKASQIKEDDDVMGNTVKVKVVKNKVALPFIKAEYDIIYDEGISKVGEIIDLGVNLNVIKKSGSWFSYRETRLGQGRDSVKAFMGELNVKIKEVLGATGNVSLPFQQD